MSPNCKFLARGSNAKIKIGKNVPIGRNVFIAKNVCIWENSIVGGGGSVVTKNVASNSIVVGIPAKLHKETI